MKYYLVRLTICGIILFMTACMTKSPTPPTATPNPPPPKATIPRPTETLPPPTPDLTAEIDSMLNNFAEIGTFSGAALIARNGAVLLSQGYGLADREQNIPNTSQTKFRIGSITKQFTAMAILILQTQKKLDVQDPICNYLTDCHASWKAITIHHLMTHTSGIPDFHFSNIAAWATPSTPEENIARFEDLGLAFQPGDGWMYSNPGYMLLGYIIEQVTGNSYEEFLQQKIFTPLDMRNTGYDQFTNGLAVGYKYRDRVGSEADFIDMSNLYAAGGLFSTVEDLYRWDQALYTERLISQELLDRMFTPYATLPNPYKMAYGYGWFIWKEHGRQIIEHDGGLEGFVAKIRSYPSEHVTIILLSNQQYTDTRHIQEILSKMIFGDT